MFTGIVEEIGSVLRLVHPATGDAVAGGQTRSEESRSGSPVDAVLTVKAPEVTHQARPGQSISVDGVCLTLTDWPQEAMFTVDVMPETLDCTALADLRPGSPVNLERALRADGRLDGHLVQGHVDGVTTLIARTPGQRWDDLVFTAPRGLSRYIATKGSVAVSGVSLTVTKVTTDTFGVSLIPTTLARTTLGRLVVGDRVNLEVDVLAKYTERLLAGAGPAEPGAGAPIGTLP